MSASPLCPGVDGARVPGTRATDRLAQLAARLLGSSSGRLLQLADVPTGSLDALVVAEGEALVVVDAAADSRVRRLDPASTGAYVGVPLARLSGEVVGVLSVSEAGPRAWSEADVALLREIAASATAELELAAPGVDPAARRVAWELAVDAAGVGTFDWDLVTGRLEWDERMLQLFGYDRDGFGASIEAFAAGVHPDDRERVMRAVEGTVETGGEFALEYRVVPPEGEMRWIVARGRALVDEQGRSTRLLGAAYDTTLAREFDARVSRVLESMSAAFFLLDRDWRFAYVNARAEQLLGASRADLVGGGIWELFPLAVGTEFEVHYARAMEQREASSFEAYYPEPLDAWYEVQAWPDPDGVAVYFLDITARRLAQEKAEHAALRATLLAEVATELTSTVEAEVAVARLAELVVPALADWCLVTLVEGEGARPGATHRPQLHDIGYAHVDPAALPLTVRYAEVRFAALLDDAYLFRSLRTGTTVSLREGASAALREVLRPGTARELVAELAPDSFVVLPLKGGGRTLGLLSLFNGVGRGPITDEELTTAHEVAVRSGLALDSSRLYRQQRDLAEELQRSLLSDPPPLPGAEIVVRYSPAAEAAQVGGDWYDAFRQPDGGLVLAIGDVVGHDTAAAAAMGQVRTMLRTVAATTGAGPADVLRAVDGAMETLQVGVTATAVVARIDDLPGGGTTVCWSNAGHPPPLVLQPDGTLLQLMAARADLLLGMDPGSDRAESTVELEAGATVLLYTDGLIERRGQSLDDGLARLRGALEDLAAEGLGLEQLCDGLLARLLPERTEDDVALVAVRAGTLGG
ncbi:SpoIIE family protein phosphatase [Motilibacter peucedani]|uniref:SpoIIE family protein phosphatase n=1 Tax=Motilibacter peucedani TaxID=598650 RepID=UPI0015FF49E5|nr:SpoIIE family protein phosphatase [Motilibacter peucedani]